VEKELVTKGKQNSNKMRKHHGKSHDSH